MADSKLLGKTLQFAPFEHYMLADDSAACPMCFFLKFRFSGQPIQDEFSDAAKKAISRHPLLRSKVRGPANGRTRDLFWEIVDSPDLTIDWYSDDDLSSFDANPQIDLRQEIGLRLFLFEDTVLNESTLLVQAHHACTDATGILQFISDLLTIYGQSNSANGVELQQLNQESVIHRSKFDTTRWQWFLRSGRDIKRLIKFARNTPDPIAARSSPSYHSNSDNLARPWHCDRQLTVGELGTLRSFAKRHSVSVNDVLLHCLFRTLHQWNLEHDSTKTKVRIGIAINLRPSSVDAMPAMNLVSLAFINRPDSDERIAALQSISDETRYIKDYRMGLLLCRVVAAFGKMRGGMQRLLNANRSVSTSILSNLGDPFGLSDSNRKSGTHFCWQASDIAIEQVDLLPPLRKNIDVVFGAVTHKDRLSIALHFNPSRLSKSDAEDLLDQFIGSLRDESQNH